MKFAEYMAEQRRLAEERREHARRSRQARHDGTPAPPPLPPELPPEQGDWSVPRKWGPFHGVSLMVVPEPCDPVFVALARQEIAAATERARRVLES